MKVFTERKGYVNGELVIFMLTPIEEDLASDEAHLDFCCQVIEYLDGGEDVQVMVRDREL
jgi:hypothetical protein